MKRTTLLPLAATAAVLAAVPAARADTLLTPAPAGSSNLASGGGHLVWSQPEGSGFRLVVRRPDGTVVTPAIPAFTKAPDAAIGSTGHAVATKRLVAVYERDGDVLQLDLEAGTESEVPGAATSAYRESAPSIAVGVISFVRRGGARNGIHVVRKGRARRVSGSTPPETAVNGSRVAYRSGDRVLVKRLSGEGRAMRFAARGARDLQLTRYQAAWRTDAGLFRTARFGGSGEEATTEAGPAARTPEGLVSFAVGASTTTAFFLDAEGVKRADGGMLR